MKPLTAALFSFSLALSALAADPPVRPKTEFHPTTDALDRLRARNETLGAALQRIDRARAGDVFDDVAIYHKAVDYALRYPEQFYLEAYYTDALKLVDVGLRRAEELQRGAASWPAARGPVCRAYESKVDGSLQPYALWVPAGYDPAKPSRLDVVLHGRNQRLTEVSFLTQGGSERVIGIEGGRKTPPENLTLYVFGRGNNSYFWSGESDVFEALASVRRRYNVDPDRIVLRGFSMGGTGAWHLGLHFPSRWAAVEAGAGFVQTRPEVLATIHEDFRLPALAIHDNSNCSVNMGDLPFVAYAGELDAQREEHKRIKAVLERDSMGIAQMPRARFVVGPGVGHTFQLDSKRESDAFIAASLPRRRPEEFRFVTYTPSYGEFWDLHVDALEQLYQRAEVRGTWDRIETSNVWVLKLDAPRAITIDGQKLSGTVFTRENGSWKAGEPAGLRKRSGLQGPIDDAFQQPFLCVASPRGDNPTLSAFHRDFARYFRGDIRVKSAPEVTPKDIADFNLILFGEPETNPWIARVLPQLPLKWTADKIEIAGRTFDAATHTVALIYPNPLNPNHYIVLNTGHTFPCDQVEDMHWFLHPRLGDYAVLDKQTRAPALVGFFDKAWRVER